MDRYAVIGNPVAHSKSPQIHAAFARATGQAMSYERLPAPLGGFAEVATAFAREGGLGLNVTVPFKLDALAIADKASERAHAAGACNTLKREHDEWYADNTDGAGIIRDLTFNLGVGLRGRDVLVLGAGGAARGSLAVRATAAERDGLQPHHGEGAGARRRFGGRGPLTAISSTALAGRRFDVIVNATSAGLSWRRSLWLWPATALRGGQLRLRHGLRRRADGIPALGARAGRGALGGRPGHAGRTGGGELRALARRARPATAPVFDLLRPGR